MSNVASPSGEQQAAKPTLDSLGDRWLAAKAAVEQAQSHLANVEAEIIAVTGKRAEAGQMTVKGDDKYQATIKTVWNTRVDWKKYDEIKAQLPTEITDHLVKQKPEMVEAGVKYLRENKPELYGILAQALTISEGKTGVTLEPLKKK